MVDTDKLVKNESELEVMRTAGNEVINIVSGERNICYGTPSENHDVTGGMWGLYLTRKFKIPIEITGSDVCWMNTLQKASRQAHWPKRDNAIDAAGYSFNSLACDHAAELKKPKSAALPLETPKPTLNRLPGTDSRDLPPVIDNRHKSMSMEEYHNLYGKLRDLQPGRVV